MRLILPQRRCCSVLRRCWVSPRRCTWPTVMRQTDRFAVTLTSTCLPIWIHLRMWVRRIYHHPYAHVLLSSLCHSPTLTMTLPLSLNSTLATWHPMQRSTKLLPFSCNVWVVPRAHYARLMVRPSHPRLVYERWLGHFLMYVKPPHYMALPRRC